MNKSIVAFAVMLVGMTFSIAQTSNRISGKVVDKLTGEPLPFSHVGIFDSSYGTIANADGEFTLIIPTKYANSELSASYLGYELKSFPVASIDKDKDLLISLKSTVTELPELIITTNEQSIMEEAIEAIPRNHDQNEMKLRAFWRASIWSKTDNYVQLTEYAFDMYRHGNSGEETNDMKILNGRIARDSSFFNDIGNMQIGVKPETLFASSLLKEHAILDKKILRQHIYSIVDATSYNDRAVFVVDFKPKKNAEGKGYEGKILLDTETLAFVKISYKKRINEENPEKVFSSFSLASMLVGLGKSTLERYENELNYQLVDGKWYLSYAKYDIDWTMRKSKGDIEKPVRFMADFVVTDISKENIVVPPAEELASNSILEGQATGGSEDFWKEYNYLKADPGFEQLFAEVLERK